MNAPARKGELAQDAGASARTDLSQFYAIFFEEAAEHLTAMEGLLLQLDPAHASDDDLNAIFRAAHSIKGGSGTFGFTDMTEVTHELESLLDKARKRELVLTDEMINALLAAGDVLTAQLDFHRGNADHPPDDAAQCCEQIRSLAAGHSPTAGGAAATALPAPTVRCLEVAFPRPRSKADRAALDNALRELARLGQVVEPQVDGKKGTPQRLHVTTSADPEEIRTLLSFAVAPEQVTISTKTEGTSGAPDEAYGLFDDAPAPPAGDPGFGFFDDLPDPAPAASSTAAAADGSYGFFESDEATPSPVAQPVAAPPPSPDRRTDPIGRRASDRGEADPAGRGRRETDRAPASAAEMTSIRVGVEKVDQLINLVGELVITQAMLAQTVSRQDGSSPDAMNNSMAQLERNTRDLQEAVMSIRMMPISFVFSRFPRVVRDLAAKLGKQVNLKTVGEGTEIDKGLIEKLADPLTHLVRNSLDHGIETPEVRLAAGKPAAGTITLHAYHQGGSIIIDIIDDGAGLNRKRILAKAAERGLPVSDRMSDSEVWQLIFEAGFSTAAVVTDVSGRGVGMDVVKRNIQGMGGRVDISSSEGAGTKIAIRLPLTLAILDGMSIAVGNELYILPLTCIVESLQPRASDIKSVAGQGLVIEVRGEYLPIVALHDFFNITPSHQRMTEGILVIIEANGQKTAVFVDRLIGQHQVVIKSLETNYRKVRGISGATIMGDGRVAMILDPAAIASVAAMRGNGGTSPMTQ